MKWKYHHLRPAPRLGLVAQLVERRISKPKVPGSNPSRSQVEFSPLIWYGFVSLGVALISLKIHLFEKFSNKLIKQLRTNSCLWACKAVSRRIDTSMNVCASGEREGEGVANVHANTPGLFKALVEQFHAHYSL